MTRIFKRIVTGLAVLLLGGSLWLIRAHPSVRETSGPGGQDLAQSVAVSEDGQIVVAGYSYSERSDYDFLTLKYDAGGRLLWTARYDGPAGLSDYASAVSVDSGGNVFTAGHSNGRGTSLDLTVIKYDKNGRELWAYRYDGPSHRDDYAQSMAVDASGHVYVTGYSFGLGTEHDFITIKLAPDGMQMWSDRHNPPRNRDDSSCDLALHPESGIVITGTDRVGNTSYDFLTIRYDTHGKRIWEARCCSPGNIYDTARALDVGADGSVYVTGYSDRLEAGFDMVTLKYDSGGGLVWKSEYGGPVGRMDAAVDIAADKSGQVYVAGKSIGDDSSFDICLLKYDSEGRLAWQKRYNGPGKGADVPAVLCDVSPDGVVLSGYSRGIGSGRDILTQKYDSEGALLWEKRWKGRAEGEDRPTSMAIDGDGCIIIAGYTAGEDGTFDFLTLKYEADGRLLWASGWPEK